MSAHPQPNSNTKTPTLYEWLGGAEPLTRFINHFYQKVLADPLLAPVFAAIPVDHLPQVVQHVIQYIAEVLGGPAEYSSKHGGHAQMMQKHFGRNISEQQRQRWLSLLLQTADEENLPSDPEFRSAFIAYFEWGSRHAVIASGLPADTSVAPAPMPAWNWGVPGGPSRQD